jgi:hypothetical protein
MSNGIPVVDLDVISADELQTRTGDNRDLFFYSGVITHSFSHPGPAPGGAWARQDVRFRLAHWWEPSVEVAAIFSPASFQDDNVATNAGWAVDGYRRSNFPAPTGAPPIQIELTARVAVRDVDASILRISFFVTAVGQVRPWPGP